MLGSLQQLSALAPSQCIQIMHLQRHATAKGCTSSQSCGPHGPGAGAWCGRCGAVPQDGCCTPSQRTGTHRMPGVSVPHLLQLPACRPAAEPEHWHVPQANAQPLPASTRCGFRGLLIAYGIRHMAGQQHASVLTRRRAQCILPLMHAGKLGCRQLMQLTHAISSA